MILNLVHPGKSDIKYKIFTFPDGEIQIEILDELLNCKQSIDVYCRIKSMNDLFIVLQVADILDRHELKWDLYISYLMSMRMDRVMSFSRPFSLKIITSMLHSCKYQRISVLEPHSDVTTDLLDLDLRTGVYHTESFNHKWFNHLGKEVWGDEICLVAPDVGAAGRYAFTGNHIVFSKKRDVNTGRILGFTPDLSNVRPSTKRFVFVDDLCDGGGTFLGELEVLEKKYPDCKFELFVTHAVNRGGLAAVVEAFDKVYVTNSYEDWTPLDKLEVIEVI